MNTFPIDRCTLQMLTTNLDRKLMTLSAAKNYLSAYGLDVKGRTKEQFLKNFYNEIKKTESFHATLNKGDS